MEETARGNRITSTRISLSLITKCIEMKRRAEHNPNTSTDHTLICNKSVDIYREERKNTDMGVVGLQAKSLVSCAQ